MELELQSGLVMEEIAPQQGLLRAVVNITTANQHICDMLEGDPDDFESLFT